MVLVTVVELDMVRSTGLRDGSRTCSDVSRSRSYWYLSSRDLMHPRSTGSRYLALEVPNPISNASTQDITGAKRQRLGAVLVVT